MIGSSIAATESEMCVQAVLELVAQDSNLEKVLDLGACKGDIGQKLTENGLSNVYGHEGSEAKKQRLLKKGAYREIETYIVGK
jgi:hypothetical protein